MFAGEVDLKTWYKPKIDQKTSELLRLQSTSKSLSNEAGSRKSKSKLSIF